jgi:hypothetical protein
MKSPKKDNYTLALQFLNLFFIKAIKVIVQRIWIFEELGVFVSIKHQVLDIPRNENNFSYASTNSTYGRSVSANSGL